MRRSKLLVSSHRRAAATSVALSVLASLAHAQFAPAPAAADTSPWARAYRSCAEQALMRHVADRDAAQVPGPDLVALAEHDCAANLPMPGIGIDKRDVDLVVAAEHRDLMSHFSAKPTYVYTTPLSAPSTTMQVDGATCPKPEYPPAAVRSNAQGVTRVELTVNAGGRVVGLEVTGASGPTREHRLLDNAAKAAFGDCVFKHSEVPVRHEKLEYVWRLE